jgi:hypothetical protein
MTQKDLDRIAEEAGVQQPKPKKPVSPMQRDIAVGKEVSSAPGDLQNEDRIMYWLWGKINPTYSQYVSKDRVLGYIK